MSRPSANSLYKACQKLVKQGQPVFPCHSSGDRTKAPMTRHGVHDASLDIRIVKQWWRSHGDAAIGIPTGIVWDVLDVDVKAGSDGRQYLPRLLKHGWLNGCKKLVRTPSGGWHLYFLSSPSTENTNHSRSDLGLDARGKGGYVIAPPSYIDNGSSSVGSYEWWEDPEESSDEPLMWEGIINTIAPVSEVTKQLIPLPSLERQASVTGLRAWLFDREVGERNNALHWAVRRCLDGGIDPHELEEVALHIGLTEHEVTATIEGAIRRTGASPNELLTEAESRFGRE